MTCSLQLILIASIFAVTVVIVSRGIQLPYAVSVSAVLIAMTVKLSPFQFINLVGETLANRSTLDLLVAVVLIRWLGDLMNRSGSLSRSSELLQAIVGDLRVVAASIPMLVGLLMVPGGAILSAPSVEQLTDDMGFQPSKQAAVNLIFRHVGQIFFPMSASLLMLTSMVGVNLVHQVLHQLPIAIGIGLFSFRFYFSSVKHDIERAANREDRLSLFKALIVELSPILVILIVFALTQQIAWALMLGTVWVFCQYRLSIKEILSSFQLKASFENMLLIIGILTIRSILQNEVITEAVAIPIMRSSLTPIIISFLPWIIGFFTGSVLAAVSLVAPLLLPLINTDTGAHFFCTAIFMGAFGGYLVSPIHLCLSLTAEYYDVTLGEVYRDAWAPAGAFFVCAVISGILFEIL
jgi:hypothetical protein